jgi:hypothetical protein
MVSLMHGLAYLCLTTAALSAQHIPASDEEHDRLVTGRPLDIQLTGAVIIQPLGFAVDSTPQGLVITEVFVQLPAYNAGICRGDRLISMDHKLITTVSQAKEALKTSTNADVMVDVLRGDMRICRRVERSDGPIRQVGTAVEGRLGCVAFQGFTTGTPEELDQQLIRVLQRLPDTIIVDLRNNPDGSVIVADQVARSITSSIQQHSQPVRIILLRHHGASDASHVLSRNLVQHCSAEIVMPMSNEGRNRSAASLPTHAPWTLSDVGSQLVRQPAHAPIHWNMAEFRHRYPEPSGEAIHHGLFVAHPDIAPIAWGINGVAWDGLNIVRSQAL